MYCNAADSEAAAATTMVCSIAPVLFELAHHAGDRGVLLPDGDVDAEDVAALLVDDGVDRDRRLPGLPVADDQLPLPAPDRHHRVDGLEPGLHRLAHRLVG